MKRTICLSILCSICLLSCVRSKNDLAHTFLSALNNYNRDSLQLITSESFQWKEVYENYGFMKKEFLDSFVLFSKAINGKFIATKILLSGDSTVFIVEDITYYSTYLKLKPLFWKISIISKNDKIDRIESDTTIGYKEYLDDFMIKHEKFVKWLTNKYPQETESALFHNMEALFEKRLKEYSISK